MDAVPCSPHASESGPLSIFNRQVRPGEAVARRPADPARLEG
jgi:hypothetical protein